MYYVYYVYNVNMYYVCALYVYYMYYVLGVEEKVSYSGYSVLRTVDQENSAIKTLQQSLQVKISIHFI